MESQIDSAAIEALVRRVFQVEDITSGTVKAGYLLRYRGHLYGEDSAASYDQLAEYLRPYSLTPLFRLEEGKQVILITTSQEKPKPSDPKINLILFILTLVSVLVSGGLYNMQTPLQGNWVEAAWGLIRGGLPFAITMIVVLGAHEFGHYLAGRYHGVHVTLPYFIPMPLSPFGTMGAFINMKEQPKNRRQLMDIGLAGPLAGVAAAIPALIIGLRQSSVHTLPGGPQGMGFTMEGNSILYLLMKYFAFGKMLPMPQDFEGLSPILFWIRYFFSGRPIPYGASDVLIGPVAFAAWAGLLVTGLNLIPAGQLDGGHILYVLFGQKTARRVFPFVLGFMAILGLFWGGWWLWVMLLFFLFGRVYDAPLDQITPLDTKRKLLGVFGLVLFFLTFTPVPMMVFP